MDIDEVKTKIQDWLLQGGFKVSSVSDDKAYFNYAIEDKAGRITNIYQNINRTDLISIATRGRLSEKQIYKIMKMREDEKNILLWNIRMAVMDKNVGFNPIEFPLKEITISTAIYYDGLTKDNFMHRMFEVRKTFVLLSWIIDQALGEPMPTIQLL